MTNGPIDEPTPQEISEAAAEVAAVAAALARKEPTQYVSQRKGGPVEIARMDPTWAGRAARAVAEGRRPQDSPRVIPPLERRAREG